MHLCCMDGNTERIIGGNHFLPGNQSGFWKPAPWALMADRGFLCLPPIVLLPYKSSTPTPDTWYRGPFVNCVYVWDVECCRDGRPPHPSSPSGCVCWWDRRHWVSWGGQLQGGGAKREREKLAHSSEPPSGNTGLIMSPREEKEVEQVNELLK